MKGLSTIMLAALAPGSTPAAEPGLVAHWTLDDIAGGVARDAGPHGHNATVCGPVAAAAGVLGPSARLDGISSRLEVAPEGLDFPGDFTVSLWVNVYGLDRGQQMIAAKNRYSLDEREWGLMVDSDNRFALYIRRGGWQTVAAATTPDPGHWCHVAAVLQDGTARLFVNGRLEGEKGTGTVEKQTPAPLTLGGSNDNGRLWQMLWGAIDDVRVYGRALAEEEIRAMQIGETGTHDIPAATREAGVVLWDPDVPVPNAAEIPRLQDVRFEVIKKREPEVDGYKWLHGVAIYRYKDTFFTSWGANVGKENTPGEVVLGRRSTDDCRTWSDVEAIGPTVEGEGRSHGVFLAHGGRLWAFHSRFGKGEGRMFPGLGMEAFILNEETDAWEPQGIVAQGFWPLREPVKMKDGNWFIPGCDEDWRAAVAVSHGDDLLRWDTVKIPVGERVITEATAWVDEDKITLVMRNQSPLDPANIRAAVSFSRDFGRTWSDPVESNMPLSTSKPYCGYLSTGQRYLLGNSVRGGNNSREHLTIAVSRPGQEMLCRMWLIRDAEVPGSLRDIYGYTDPQRLAYPHAIEHDGQLYVVYSAGHLGANQNSAELAVIPVGPLAVDD
jgi:hypothetical protein